MKGSSPAIFRYHSFLLFFLLTLYNLLSLRIEFELDVVLVCANVDISVASDELLKAKSISPAFYFEKYYLV